MKAALGRRDDAIADYDEAIRLNPDDALAYYNRGNSKDTLVADLDDAPVSPIDTAGSAIILDFRLTRNSRYALSLLQPYSSVLPSKSRFGPT